MEHCGRVEYIQYGQSSPIRPITGSRLVAKARQAAKLSEIREALVADGCHTTAKQGAALGISRPTALVVLNRDKRDGVMAGHPAICVG
jgi:hypothetical protein